MDAITMKIRKNYIVSDVKEIMINSVDDVDKLPTSNTVGSFLDSDTNEPCAIGSVAYTPDFSFIYQLGVDNIWRKA